MWRRIPFRSPTQVFGTVLRSPGEQLCGGRGQACDTPDLHSEGSRTPVYYIITVMWISRMVGGLRPATGGPMDDLVQFLHARLDEDEQIARRADEEPWRLKTLGRHDQAAVSTNATTGLVQLDGARATANGVHIVRHDPVRVLAEVEAKRKLLALHEPHQQPGRYSDVNDRATWMMCCSMCQVDMVQESDWPCETMRLLALPYADHPNYSKDWRP